MTRRLLAGLLTLLLLAGGPVTALACDEAQSNAYLTELLLGQQKESYESRADMELILDALYLCSMQWGTVGEDRLEKLKKARLSGVPSPESIRLSEEALYACSHNRWDFVSAEHSEAQSLRRDLLRRSLTKVFDFGWFQEHFQRDRGQIDDLAALLCDVHILADYLADDPRDTEFSAKGYDIPAYSGAASREINGGIPDFTEEQKQSTTPFKNYSELDRYGRCGEGLTCIGPEVLKAIPPRADIGSILPTGWDQKSYDRIMPTGEPLYNRCHLVAHSLGGMDTEWNLVTGTRYLNEAMAEYERAVADYIRETGGHVLYRAVPVYVGSNLVVSGIHLEAYSLEDQGKGICFSRYFYNVQPGVDIDYKTGSSQMADLTLAGHEMLPFALSGASGEAPDLMYEIQDRLGRLFAGQKDTAAYSRMMDELDGVADRARNVTGDKSWQVYGNLKVCQHEYMGILLDYVPELLSREPFYREAFPAAS